MRKRGRARARAGGELCAATAPDTVTRCGQYTRRAPRAPRTFRYVAAAHKHILPPRYARRRRIMRTHTPRASSSARRCERKPSLTAGVEPGVAPRSRPRYCECFLRVGLSLLPTFTVHSPGPVQVPIINTARARRLAGVLSVPRPLIAVAPARSPRTERGAQTGTNAALQAVAPARTDVRTDGHRAAVGAIGAGAVRAGGRGLAPRRRGAVAPRDVRWRTVESVWALDADGSVKV